MEWNLQLELNENVRICCGCSRKIRLRIDKRFSVHSNFRHLRIIVSISNERNVPFQICWGIGAGKRDKRGKAGEGYFLCVYNNK